MENPYSWLIILSGTTITVLGSFLLASERELRNKRRQFDELKRSQTAKPQHGESTTPSELITKNEELVKEISSLSNRLEESQRTLDETQNERLRLLSVQSENQRLQEQTTELRNQLKTNEDRRSAVSTQQEAIAGRHEELQTSFAASKQRADELATKNKELLEKVDALSSKLAVSEKSVEELRTIQHQAVLEYQRLLANNRELQREIADVHKQLEMAQSQLSELAKRNREASERNDKLQSETGGLKQQLEQRQAAIDELQSAERRLSEIQSESQKLQLDNEGLREELENHRSRLNASETRLQEAARRNQEAYDRCARLESAVADFKQQLEDSQSKAREIESAQQQLANVASREMIYREQQQKLEAQIADLQRELAEGESKVQALEDAHERLRQSERVCRELGVENRRLKEEISSWQQRLEASDEKPRQVSIVAESSSELDKSSANKVDDRMQSEIAVSETKLLNDGSNEPGGEQTQLISEDSGAGIHIAKEQEANRVVRTLIQRKWRFQAVTAVVVVAIAGAVAMGFLGSSNSTSKEAAVALKTNSDEYTAGAVSEPEIKKAARLRGTYETVRPTQVYGGPSENSALIANIGAGMKLNVVDSSDGWLEVRSKHGRPPGFIRQEATVRIGQN